MHGANYIQASPLAVIHFALVSSQDKYCIKGPFKNYIIQAQGRGGSAKRLYWLMWGEGGGVKQKMMDGGDVKAERASGSLFPIFWPKHPQDMNPL